MDLSILVVRVVYLIATILLQFFCVFQIFRQLREWGILTLDDFFLAIYAAGLSLNLSLVSL